MTLPKKLVMLSVTLTSAGIMGMVPYANMWIDHKAALANPVPATIVRHAQKPTAITGKPVRLIIPGLAMDLQVIDGEYSKTTGAWTLTNDKAQFAVPSAQPNNESGDTFIYGHYRREVFARLHTITPGSQAIIETDNGYRFTYTFTATEAIQPTNTDIFTYDGPPQLTIQTCSGAWFQNRQFFYFTYSGYIKI